MKLYMLSILLILYSCTNNIADNKPLGNKDPIRHILSSNQVSYIIFGQYSNDNNSRWKQWYKVTNDSSIFIYFKGGEYFNYQTKKWVTNTRSNVINQLLTDSVCKSILPLLMGIPDIMLKHDSLIGDTRTIEEHGMYVEIGNAEQKKYWKINEWDQSIPNDIKGINKKLHQAIEILDPENKD